MGFSNSDPLTKIIKKVQALSFCWLTCDLKGVFGGWFVSNKFSGSMESSLCSQELEHWSVFRTTPNRGIHRWSWTLTYPMGTGHRRRYRFKKSANCKAPFVWPLAVVSPFSATAHGTILEIPGYIHSDSHFGSPDNWTRELLLDTTEELRNCSIKLIRHKWLYQQPTSLEPSRVPSCIWRFGWDK